MRAELGDALRRRSSHSPHSDRSPPQVRAELAKLGGQWAAAENLLLAYGKVDDTIAMYQEAHK